MNCVIDTKVVFPHLRSMNTFGERLKPLPVVLNEVSNCTDDWQFKKVQFLARALLPYGHVEEADSIPKLYRKLKEYRDTCDRAVYLLKRVLDKASVTPRYTEQLNKYLTAVRENEDCSALLFREMLLKVAEELGNEFFETLLGLVEDVIKAHPTKIKDTLELFQHLINIGVLKDAEESLDTLMEWLDHIGRQDTKAAVQEYKELHHPQSELRDTTCTCLLLHFMSVYV